MTNNATGNAADNPTGNATDNATGKASLKETVFVKDLPNKRLTVERFFDAPLDLVWQAWTDSKILDQWWGPKPYVAITKEMDFREGGMWLYLMKGPKGDGTWCRVDFNSIVPKKTITNTDTFSDEAGNKIPGIPNTYWKKEFRPNKDSATVDNANNDSTTVNIELTFDNEADLERMIQMGFQEGFTMGLSNLDHYLIQKVSPHSPS
jgi:uncharacterized protein YndB with AHSA1/START domain